MESVICEAGNATTFAISDTKLYLSGFKRTVN